MSDNVKRESVVSTLGRKIGSSALRTIFTRARVMAGQKVIDEVKDTYFDDIDELTAVLQSASNSDLKPQQIYEAVKSIKAQAEGLGFMFLMELSNALYQFLQEKAARDRDLSRVNLRKDEILVVQKHVEAILVALKNRERGKGGMVEADILHSLELLKRRCKRNGS